MAETRSAVPSQSTGTSAGVGTGLPSSATTLNVWPGSARLRISRRAGVEHVEQHALALLHADRFAVTEHAAVDGEQLVADLVALRSSPVASSSAASAHLLAAPRRAAPDSTSIAMSPPWLNDGLEFLHHQEHFAVVGAGIVLRLDIDRTGLARVGAAVRDRRRLRHACDRSESRRASGTKAMRRMPCGAMNGVPSSAAPSTSLGIIWPCQCTSSGVSVSLCMSTTTRWPSVKPQQRTGKLAVVERGRDDVVGRKLDQAGGDAQRVVRLLGRLRRRPTQGAALHRSRGPVRQTSAANGDQLRHDGVPSVATARPGKPKLESAGAVTRAKPRATECPRCARDTTRFD